MTVIRRVLSVLAVAVVIVSVMGSGASAHPLNTSAVRLDIGATNVTAIIDLPLDQLSMAVAQELTATTVVEPSTLARLRAYVQEHMSATDATGMTWSAEVTGGLVASVDSADNLVLDATLTPASGAVGDFVLHFDAIVDKLISHRVFVSARYGHTGAYTTLAMLSWQTQSVPVASATSDTTPALNSQGFVSAVHLGFEHINGGSDHLLFLIMLLLPAPLAVSHRRWVRRRDLKRAGWRVLHVVTAFAVGHSITLALGAFGWVHLPARLVESGIALSVLVSALHAIRPLVRRGELVIAGSFGLLHGLAFAALLGELNLTRRSLLTTLFGFNIGIEIAQLLVVALVMPSLIVISRTAAYSTLRNSVAGLGAVIAAGWLGERTGMLASNPLEPVGELLVKHPAPLAFSLGAVALLSASAQRIGYLRPIKLPMVLERQSRPRRLKPTSAPPPSRLRAKT